MAILGAVLGDILGSQYEFDRPKNLDWKNVPLIGDSGVGFTDDTVMALAIKKVLDEKLQKMATRTAEVSHNHQEGIKGAIVTATCIWMAKHGKSKQEIYDYVLKEYPPEKYPFSIDKDMEYLRKHYIWTEKCSDTVPAAMRCFYESQDYESFIRNIFSFECDSDTFGAIAGGVAEEFYHGFGNLEAEKIVKEYLSEELQEILFSK